MRVAARRSLLPDTLPAGDLCLLLEGDWPASEQAPRRLALDSVFDARHGWLDAEAARLASDVAELAPGVLGPQAQPDSAGSFDPTWGDVLALRLRYYLLKLLRVVEFFEQSSRLPKQIVAELARPRDMEYGQLLDALGRAHGIAIDVRWHEAPMPAAPPLPRNAAWRRACASLASKIAVPRGEIAEQLAYQHVGERVLLCGHPGRLDRVCAELLGRGDQPAWLFERFAVGVWWRWGHRAPQLVLRSTADGAPGPTPPIQLASSLSWRGVDLTRVVEHWLSARARELHAHFRELATSLPARLDEFSPRAIVLDEDATPLARLAMHWARAAGVPTMVVQHGAPCVRFGFAPRAADRMGVWGEATRRQLQQWGVEQCAFALIGCPWLDDRNAIAHKPRRERSETHVGQHPLRVLILDTVPPRDDRPDALEFHLTTRTYSAMLDTIVDGLRQFAESAGIGSPQRLAVAVKPHPRATANRGLECLLRQRLPQASVRRVRGSLAKAVSTSDVVLGCASSGAIEAANYGVPAIQVLPQGSAENLFADPGWSLVGTARTAAEVARLLRAATTEPRPRAGGNSAFAFTGRRSAEIIVDEVAGLIAKQGNRLCFEEAEEVEPWLVGRPS